MIWQEIAATDGDRWRLPRLSRRSSRNHYLGAVTKKTCGNRGTPGALAADVHALAGRFIRYEDMLLRSTVDLTHFTLRS